MSSMTNEGRPSMGGTQGWRAARWLDLTQLGPCVALFLILAVPILTALAIGLGPFEGADETPHFLRAVQLSQGRIMPQVQGEHAGDTLDRNVHRLASYYEYLRYSRYNTTFGEARSDRNAAWATQPSGQSEFTPFSNTVIYFPLAHAAPAAAIAVMRAAHAPPLAWLYGARFTGVVLALLLFVAAMAIFPEGRALVFVLALLPRTLFGTAAISADTLLIPLAAVFAALAARLYREGRLPAWGSALLAFSAFYVCVNKLAYVPLLLAPPALAWFSARRISPFVVLFAITGLVSLVVWAAWVHIVSRDVFSIRHGFHPDIHRQFQWVLTHPVGDVLVALRTLKHYGMGYFVSLVGGQMGSGFVGSPQSLTPILWAALVGAALLGPQRRTVVWPAFLLSAALTLACVGAIFLLIFMQFNNVAQDKIDGVQGRYFIPLIPVLAAFAPKFHLSPPKMAASTLAMCAVLVFADGVMAKRNFDYYEGFHSAHGLRYGDPKLVWVE